MGNIIAITALYLSWTCELAFKKILFDLPIPKKIGVFRVMSNNEQKSQIRIKMNIH